MRVLSILNSELVANPCDERFNLCMCQAFVLKTRQMSMGIDCITMQLRKRKSSEILKLRPMIKFGNVVII